MNLFDYIAILSALFLSLSLFMTNMLWLRLFMIIADLLELVVYYFIRPGQPLWVQITMSAVYISINLYSLFRLLQERYPIQFEKEVKELYETVFAQFTIAEFKLLLKIGIWQNAAAQSSLIEQGQEQLDPFVLFRGQVEIIQNERVIALTSRRAFFGEINFLTGMVPDNNVIAVDKVRLFILPYDKLNKLIAHNMTLRSKIYGCFGCDIAYKLKEMNTVLS